jgi:ribonucleoside-diphosphate reductase alpha chain
MALGLGVLGFHTLLQNLELSFGSLQAHTLNINIFSRLNEETYRASKYLATLFGECPITKGYGVANAHLTAISPTLSTAVIMGGVSNGIEPIYSNAYIQGTAAGKITRVNPYVLRIAKEKGIPTDVLTKELMNNNGSTQDLDWLTDEQKAVTKTAFEINQEYILRLAITRQRFITQGQSLNLFFSADETEEEISRIHQLALRSPVLKGLYYIRSTTGIKAKDREAACEACAS